MAGAILAGLVENSAYYADVQNGLVAVPAVYFQYFYLGMYAVVRFNALVHIWALLVHR